MAGSIFFPSFAGKTRNGVKYGKSWAGEAGPRQGGLGQRWDLRSDSAEWTQLSALLRIKGKADAISRSELEDGLAFRLQALPLLLRCG